MEQDAIKVEQKNGDADKAIKQAVESPLDVARRLLEEDKRKREKACLAEVNSVLERHRCGIVASAVPVAQPAEGQITIGARTQIVAKE